MCDSLIRMHDFLYYVRRRVNSTWIQLILSWDVGGRWIGKENGERICLEWREKGDWVLYTQTRD